MNKDQAINLVKETFESPFDRERFKRFMKELLNEYEETESSPKGAQIPAAFDEYVSKFERIGKYTDSEQKRVDILIVYLKRETSIDQARSMLRNFVAGYLEGKYDSEPARDAALVAFVSPPNGEDWRFSLVKLETKLKITTKGGMKPVDEFTPARRWSFLVGRHEKSHTAQSRLVPIIADDEHNPTLNTLEEAFNTEKVTNEFFSKYRDLFIKTRQELEKEVNRNSKVRTDFERKGIDTVNLAKKLLGQITFLYFLQKKGWFGVPRDATWGEGSKNFLRELFEKKHGGYDNFFNDILEPLFYDALRDDHLGNESYQTKFNCRIPFLNGGLFDPMNDYDWIHTDILLPNELFSNKTESDEDGVGDGIFDIFDRYNFTVKEDEPLEKEVAIDPELLGKAYEKFNAIRPDNFKDFLTAHNSGQKSEESKFNKQYGVYYTPPDVVHYMCQQSLINFLETGLVGKVDIKDIETLVLHGEQIIEHDAHAVSMGKEAVQFLQMPLQIRNNAAFIDDKIAKIKVCDLAVGSGAFPVGMMIEIVKIRLVLESYTQSTETPYNLKRNCIEDSLYGVDIDPGAVEIAKLRLWLSLIVDEDDINTIKPLPNLDYKIMRGNSLLGLPEGVLLDTEIILRIESLKKEYFYITNSIAKRNMRDEINGLFLRLVDIARQYAPELNQIMFDFHTHFSEIFPIAEGSQDRRGFDVVITNPPYVGQKGNQKLFNEMKHDTNFEKKMDYWYFFLHTANAICKDNGITTFITPNYWVTANGAKKLRNKITNKYYFIEWINFNDNNVFEAGIHTNIFILRKKELKNTQIHCTIYNKTYNLDLINQKAKESNFYVDQNYLYQPWTGFVHFIPHGTLQIVNKLINNSFPLCDSSTTGKRKEGTTAGKHVTDGICNINQGLVTGKDRYLDKEHNEGVFVLTRTEYEQIDQKDRVKLRPFYKNSDLKRYYANQTPKYYLVSVNDIETEEELKNYPSIYSHLSKYKKCLMKRSINGVLESAYQKGKWWAMTTDRPNINFNGEKILCPQRSRVNTFAYSNESWYASADVYYITKNKEGYSQKYILSILNSKLIYYWLYHMGKRKGEMLELYLEPLQYIPIKAVSEDMQIPFIELANRILTAKKDNPLTDTSVIEEEIDQLVYRLYGLTKEEELIVKGE